jgi:tyrosine-protein kinase Etk/Wzc
MASQDKKELEHPIPDEVALSRMYATEERTAVLGALLVVAKRKRFIIGFISGTVVIALVTVFLLPKYYTGTTKILPPQQNQSIAMSLLGQLGPLAALAGGGKDLGIRNQNDMYVAMIRSRTIADALVDHYSLMQLYREKTRVDARKDLESKTEVVSGKDGIISISVEDKDPARAAKMANSYVEELEKLTQTLAVTDTGRKRRFFEREVKTANDDLAKAEDALKATQQTTGLIQLDSQARAMLQAYAELRAQATAKEVELASIRSFATADNPDLIRVQRELEALRSQVARFEQGPGHYDVALGRVPTAGLAYVRSLREVKYRETLLELLTKQYEINRIDEAEGAGLIQVLDKAIPPEKRSWPPRLALVLASTLAALIMAVAAVFLMEVLQKAHEDPQFEAQWQLLKSYLRRPLKT